MQTEIKWAFIISFMTFAWFVAEFAMGLHGQYMVNQPASSMFSLIIPLVGYYIALKIKKTVDFKNKMTWKQGFLSGITIVFICSITSLLLMIFYFNFINPQFFHDMNQFGSEYLINNNPEVSNKAEAMEQIGNFYSYPVYLSMVGVSTFAIGWLLSALYSLLLKTA